MDSTHVLVAVFFFALSSGCDADVRRSASESEEERDVDGGSDGTGGAGNVRPGSGGSDPDLAMCPDPPARPGGLRDGAVPSGSVDAEEAASVFLRASHEVGHLVDVLRSSQGEEQPDDLLIVDGDAIFGDRDGEAVRGSIARDPSTGRMCAAIRFGAWTGGHGSWGLSALDGTMVVVMDDAGTKAQGTLGLVDSEALEGAPFAEVRVEHDGELLRGSVDGFDF